MPLQFAARSLDDPISQGDIIQDIPVVDYDKKAAPTLKSILGLVISHSCELDKAHSNTVLVIELRSMVGLSPEFAAKIRDSEVWNAIHVGEVPGVGDSYLDFRRLCRAIKQPLIEQIQAKRVAAIAETACKQVALYLYGFLTRSEQESMPPAAQPPPAAPTA